MAPSQPVRIVDKNGVPFDANNPLPTSASLQLDEVEIDFPEGLATEAKQDAAIEHLDAIETATEAIAAAVDGTEVQVDLVGALPAGSNDIGATKDSGPHWTTTYGVSGARVTSADATGGVAVTAAPSSGQKLVITDLVVSVDTAMRVDFLEETSGTVVLTLYLPANGSAQITPRGKLKLATADKKLMVDTSVAGNIAVTAFYYSEA